MNQIFGVIGYPIAHSMSPDMHNDSFKHLGIQATYLPFAVRPEDLQDAIKGMKAIGIQGFNVTIPHKTDIMPFLDKIDSLAAEIGAINTVKLEGGEYVGYNTDGLGFVKGIKEQLQSSLADQKVLIVGAGGAARGIYYSLLQEGARHVDIANRTISKGEQLIAGKTSETKSVVFSIAEAEKILSEYTLIINTTSIGMHPNINESPLSLKNMKPLALVSDIIYNPLQTKLLKEAANKGALIQNGIPMFVHQGALAFQLWTGKQPDTERMRKIVLTKLGG